MRRRRRAAPPENRRGNLAHLSQNQPQVRGTQRTRRDSLEAMLAYDKLPPRLRRELRRAPFDVDPVGALEFTRKAGEWAALQTLQNSLNLGLVRSAQETGLRTGVCRD